MAELRRFGPIPRRLRRCDPTSDAAVASTILWVYGWIGLALVSALLGPAWAWLAKAR